MSPGSRMFPAHSPRFALAAGLVFFLIVLTLLIRILSPPDIVARDQSRMVSQTVDIVRNGNLLLASDADGFLASNPPLVNYLSGLLVASFGPSEWTFVAPSLLAFFATLALIYLIARDLFVQMPPHDGWLGLTAAEWAVLLAVTCYGLSEIALRLAFAARPDMVLVFCLTLSFYAANRALALQPPQGAGWAFVFWLAASLARARQRPDRGHSGGLRLPRRQAFSRWLGREPSFTPHDRRADTRWLSRSPGRSPSMFWRRSISATFCVDQELGGQFAGKWYSGVITAWQVPLWVISHFLPWSLLLLVAAWVFPWRQWRAHPLAPALLYILLLAIPFLWWEAGVATASRRSFRCSR